MKEVISILVAIIGVFATLGGVVLTFYLANRLTLNDSMDSKSGWRKGLMDIASKDEITLADIYRIRASVRYYPHLKPTQLSFRWMTNLIIKLCDEYFVEVYKYKKAGTNNGGQNIIIIQSAINSSRQFRRRLTNSTVAVSPENDEIVRIICRYLLKYHWEARQKMRIFRRGRDLMNIDDDEPSEAAARTIQLILEQVKKMDDNQNNDSSKDIKKIIDETLLEAKSYENTSNYSSNVVHSILILSFSAVAFSVAYKIFTLKSVNGKIKIEFISGLKELFEGFVFPFIAMLLVVIVILIICCRLDVLCCLLKKWCLSSKK
ncbi:hypothetical protein G8B22_08995 [Ligilactobacillus agilis]|uniref:hypothetical protein n=1 Tax=Ligilactobacillus agilis TaxID=1601 RepID=UPI00067EA9BE|nr:hypothetical protein [Ligilactobacillus agilis]UNL43259.1 hypothetical protein G8B22_08995 [Ligilactobacillus agilis]UNL57740.1 hypothetical protein G8B19_02700 [Ligilactobacillus agilis]